MSMDYLIEKIVATKNPTVVGLDPKLEYIPDCITEGIYEQYGVTLKAAGKALLKFNKGLIDALYDIVPAVKPQAAYYEMYGYEGMKALAKTIEYAKEKGMYVIIDGKRNDIGTTMEAYATAHLGETLVNGKKIRAFQGDSLTVNGYLGTDGISPLIKVCEEYNKGIFVLVKTSNPSSGELQDKYIGDEHVYDVMANMCESWGSSTIGTYGYSCVGAVVGATYPEQLDELRKKMPHTFFLVPGYGAQGGGANDVKYAFDSNGSGAIINSSRGIICAYKNSDYSEKDYGKAAREEAIRMRDDITSIM